MVLTSHDGANMIHLIFNIDKNGVTGLMTIGTPYPVLIKPYKNWIKGTIIYSYFQNLAGYDTFVSWAITNDTR